MKYKLKKIKIKMQSLNPQKKILFINFNQDYSCFCIGTEDGYMIINAENYKRIFHRSKSKINI